MCIKIDINNINIIIVLNENSVKYIITVVIIVPHGNLVQYIF